MLHFNLKIFGDFYHGRVSSCDGAAAFLNEEPDHSAVEYFRGIGQFRERGMPLELPAAMRSALEQDQKVVRLRNQANAATNKEERKKLTSQKNNRLVKLRSKRLTSYQAAWWTARRKEKILAKGNVPPCPGTNPNPLHDAIPENGRLAKLMSRDSVLTLPELYNAMKDMLYLLTEDWSVFYRLGEKPKDGHCPECEMEMEEFAIPNPSVV